MKSLSRNQELDIGRFFNLFVRAREWADTIVR